MNHFINALLQAIHPQRLFALVLATFALLHPAQARCIDPDRFQLADDEATDRKTGLVWKRCSVGLEWLDRDGCRGAIRGLTLAEARDLSRTNAGWRLPSADELLTLVARDCGEPAIEAATFPDVPLDPGGERSIYWTATDAGMLNMTVTVDFRDGDYDMHSPGLRYFVRLVRSRQ